MYESRLYGGRERERKGFAEDRRTSRHCCKRTGSVVRTSPRRARCECTLSLSLSFMCVCVSEREYTGCPRTAEECYFPLQESGGLVLASIYPLAISTALNRSSIESNREIQSRAGSNAVDFRSRLVRGKCAIHRSRFELFSRNEMWISRKASGWIVVDSRIPCVHNSCAGVGACECARPLPSSPYRSSFSLWIFLFRGVFERHARQACVRAWNRSTATRDVAFCNEPIYLPPSYVISTLPLCVLHLPRAVLV